MSVTGGCRPIRHAMKAGAGRVIIVAGRQPCASMLVNELD